jgi:hypothetical protein
LSTPIEVASLHRGLIEEGLMVRDHGIYQRVEKPTPPAGE